MSAAELDRLHRLAKLLRDESKRLEQDDTDGAFRLVEAAFGVNKRVEAAFVASLRLVGS